jgi:hypothetical protein
MARESIDAPTGDTSGSQNLSGSNSPTLTIVPSPDNLSAHDNEEHELHSSQSTETMVLGENKDPETPLGPSWRPSYLRRRVLIGFAICFGVLALGIELLFNLSNKYQGLGSTSPNLNFHFLRTYGPTAIFTVFVALWARVAVQAKMIAPWMGLLHGKRPAPAKQTILLDYFEMWLHQVLLTAYKHRDWLVFRLPSRNSLLSQSRPCRLPSSPLSP